MNTFNNPTPATNDGFGYAVALEGDAVLVGAYLDDNTLVNAGAAYLFDGSSGGLVRTFEKPSPISGGQFGAALAMSGGTVLVGAAFDNAVLPDSTVATAAGAAYLYQGLRLIDPAPLGNLKNLQFLSLSNNHLDGVEPLANLDQLQSLHLDNNRIGDIGPLIQQQLRDDGEGGYSEQALTATDSGWLGNLGPVNGAFGQDYRFHANSADSPTTAATWTFTDVVPGSYEIFATWPEHENRASNAPYTVVTQVTQPGGGLVEKSASILVNQKFTPTGPVVGGRPWVSLGVFTTDGTTLRVELRNNADGVVAADAVRIVPVDPVTKLPVTVKPATQPAHRDRQPVEQ